MVNHVVSRSLLYGKPCYWEVSATWLAMLLEGSFYMVLLRGPCYMVSHIVSWSLLFMVSHVV